MPRSQSFLGRLVKWLLISGFAGLLILVGVAGYLYVTISPDLPPVSALREVQLQVPLRIYTADGDLIAEYGEKRREPVTIDEVPQELVNAILAAEDKRFYVHPGVDWQGLLRAFVHLVKTGEKGPGGSTITMQVARNFFLTNEKTYSRKLNEIILSLKIESELTKDEVLELYLNKIYLGNRSYGFAAASKVYYGKPIGDLNIEEAAMLAGLPKAPSRYNPIINPERAVLRRNYVLGRMHALGFITDADHQRSTNAPVTAKLHVAKPEAEADYVGEMARKRLAEIYGDTWATAGMHVYTTLDSTAQRAANKALRSGLIAYEQRHGFTGPAGRIDPALLEDPDALATALKDYISYGELTHGVVSNVGAESATVILKNGETHLLSLESVAWARARLGTDTLGDEVETVSSVLSVGDVIVLRPLADQTDVAAESFENSDAEADRSTAPDTESATITATGTENTSPLVGQVDFVQEPAVEGALIALDPKTGAIRALVGGFDFHRSKFNRVTQARRQPGSTFKPFIYSAALERGDTAATIYNDAPVVFHDSALEGEWRPSNYSGRFYGPTRLRDALVYSRNLVSVRVLREITISYAIDYALRFGFGREHLPADLSLALGSAGTSPLEVATAFSVFANGGYHTVPHFIQRIEGPDGELIYQAPGVEFCDDCYTPVVERPGVEATDEERDLYRETIDAYAAELTMVGETGFVEKGEKSPEQVQSDEAVVALPRVAETRNIHIMNSIMRDVVKRGTARKAGERFGRSDLAGKTGTTNNQLDAWFTGFNESYVASVWVGYDGLEPLGRKEAGGLLALPIWMDFMDTLLPELPETVSDMPENMVQVVVDSKTGEAVSAGDRGVREMFRSEYAPGAEAVAAQAPSNTGASTQTLRAPKPAATVKHEKRQKKKKVDQLF